MREKLKKVKGEKKAAIKRLQQKQQPQSTKQEVKPLRRRYQRRGTVAMATAATSGRENDNISLNKQESVATLLSEHDIVEDSQYDQLVTQEFLRDANIQQERVVPPPDENNGDGGLVFKHVLDMEYFEDCYSCSSLPLVDKPTIDEVLVHHDTSLIGKSISTCSTSKHYENDHQV